MIKVLILGADSTVGHVLSLFLKEYEEYDIHTVCFVRPLFSNSSLISINKKKEIEAILDDQFQIVFNCIVLDEYYTKLNLKERFYAQCKIPTLLHKKYKHTNTRVINICANNVRNDTLKSSYVEKKICLFNHFDLCKDTILYVNVVGPSIISENLLFDTFVKSKNNSHVYNNENCYAINSYFFAQKVKEMIDGYMVGIYRLKANEAVTKYDLLILLKTSFFKEIYIDESFLLVDEDILEDINTIYVENAINDYYNLRKFMIDHKEFYPKYFNSQD